MGVVVSTVFVLVGGSIVYAMIYGRRKVREQAAAEQANPEAPWLWRKDWASSRAESKNRNSAIGLWMMAIFWNLISFTVAAGGGTETLAHVQSNGLVPAPVLRGRRSSRRSGGASQYPAEKIWPNLF